MRGFEVQGSRFEVWAAGEIRSWDGYGEEGNADGGAGVVAASARDEARVLEG